MSVIVKGMEMPLRCMDCGVDTGLCGLWNGYAERYSRRHPKCPLVEIPTPHGRLIDADAVFDKLNQLLQEHDDDLIANGVISESERTRIPKFLWKKAIKEVTEE